MNAAKTRRKGRKAGDEHKNVNEMLAAAQEQSSLEGQDSTAQDNSTRTSASENKSRSKPSAKSRLKDTMAQNQNEKAKDKAEPDSSTSTTSDASDSTDTPNDSNQANTSLEESKVSKAQSTEDSKSPTDSNAEEKQTEEVQTEAHEEATQAEAPTKSEEQSEKDAKEAERLARIEKARAQAKAFAEARRKQLATQDSTESKEGKEQASKQAQDEGNSGPKDTSDTTSLTSGEGSSKGRSKGEEFNPQEESKNSGANLRAFLAGITLAFFAALCVICIITVEQTTHEQITSYRNEQEQKLLSTMLPEATANVQGKLTFQCKLLSDSRIGKNMQAYLVQDENGHNLGLIANYSTSRGYSNPLILMAGVDMQGKVTRIEVKLSKETPGIGDKVEHRRGNYLDQFVGWGLDDANWEVTKFGGQFDYITGATVTSRAVVLATKDLLQVLRETTHPDLLPNCR